MKKFIKFRLAERDVHLKGKTKHQWILYVMFSSDGEMFSGNDPFSWVMAEWQNKPSEENVESVKGVITRSLELAFKMSTNVLQQLKLEEINE